jgi:serine/threonine-protein kinase
MATGDEERFVRARMRIGTVLMGKYRLDSVLGVGGMAAVFAATHLRNANRVAVKVLNTEFAMDSYLRERFLREGYAANRVAHPGTVRVIDDDVTEEGVVFLVMDLLDGETLDARWQRSGRQLDAPEVTQLMYQLLDVLCAAHAKGVVHRDIKPANLFLTRDRVLKVLDFGVARLVERSVVATQTGGVLGTPAYMAPEQVLGKHHDVDAQSDLWSVGATAFTLLAGRYVHEAETAEEMMVFTASRGAPPLGTVLADAPMNVAEVIDRALKIDKADRWLDAREMQRAVARAHRLDFGVAVSGGEPADESEEQTRVMDSQTLLAASGGEVRALARVAAVTAMRVVRELSIVRWASRRKPTVLLLAIGVLVGIAGGSVAAIVAASRHHAASAGPPSGAAALPIATDSSGEVRANPSEVRSPADEPRAVDVNSLPAAPHPVQGTSNSRASSGPSGPARPNCVPPYVIDSTGKKKWRYECL